MTVMAVSADGSSVISLRECLRVNTLSIGKDWPITDATTLHDRFVTMAAAAGLCDVSAMNSRLRIRGWQDRRHVTILRMAIATGCGLSSTLNCLSVEAMVVRSMNVCVELSSSKIGQ